MLDVVLYVAVNIIRLPHLVVELMTDTRLATEGYVSARIWYRKKSTAANLSSIECGQGYDTAFEIL